MNIYIDRQQKTIIDKIIEPLSTLDNMRKAATMVDVLRTGLFGVYHYKIDNLEFEQLSEGYRIKNHYWVMRKNGKQYRVKYCYVVYLTFKRLGFIS